MIKIIKEPSKIFTMECVRCECVFTYEPSDIIDGKTTKNVICPCCHESIWHQMRVRKNIFDDELLRKEDEQQESKNGGAKMGIVCDDCIHYPICKYVAEHAVNEFHLPRVSQNCVLFESVNGWAEECKDESDITLK